MSKLAKLLGAVLLISALGALGAGSASAQVGLKSFDVTFTGPDGSAVNQAGSHPFAMSTAFDVNTVDIPEGIASDEAVKDLEIGLIEGFVGDQTAIPPCSSDDFLTTVFASNATGCPDSAAVGMVEIKVGLKGGFVTEEAPVYFLVAPPGKVAKIGFNVLEVPVTTEIGLNPNPPYNLIASTRYISQAIEFFGAKLTLWGNPADPAHDPQRGLCYNTPASCPAGIAEVPLLTLPRACKGALKTEWEADSWQVPGVWVKGFAQTHDDAIPPNPQGMGGCGKLGFSPSTDAQPSSTQAESSSGLDFTIDSVDEGLKNPEGIAQADIEKIVTAFPAGMTLNPSAAEGLAVCSKAQYAAESLTSTPAVGCPEASKLGSLEAETPLLANHALHGEVFLAAQDDPATTTPGAENPFDSFAAIYLVVRDPSLGIFVKLAGEVQTDEKTGQVITTLEDLPPFPLSHVSVSLRSGPRAPFITPPTCGTYTTKAQLTPSSGAAPLNSTSSFQISSGPGGSPCPAGGISPFSPGFEAGATNNAASAFSPFSMRLTRGDGEQDLTRFSATLPPGVIAKIAGVGKCPDAAIAAAKTKTGRQEQGAPSCPASSQIGHVLAGAGVGSALTYVPGSIYLAGPYNGAPLSVVAIVPAVAGPFDVGTVVTRVALRLNPVTYRAEVDGAASDPLPHILEGIPVKIREIRVNVDRPSFTSNATSCAKLSTAAQIFGSYADPFNPADDVAVPKSSPYQAASCSSLAFKPKLALSFKGSTKRSGHPALRSRVTYPYPSGPGYANIAKAVVTLPPSVQIDNAHIENPCTRVQFAENACPPSSILGTAKATSPLLEEPLEGPVYFRSNGGERILPDVVVDLHGTFQVILVGAVTTATPKSNPRLRTTFASVPDAPVTDFSLSLYGGKKGLLVNNRNTCAHAYHAKVSLTAQNGRRYETEPQVKSDCGKGSKQGKGARRR